jgi:DnaJ-class molecular chaperone
VARDYYRLLSVERNASEGEIKRAYRKLARELHPDVTGDDPRATERFKEITVAYETLSDAQRRRSYDMFGTRDAPPPRGINLDLDSLLDQVFPNRKKKPRPEPGVDLEKALPVTFIESYTGCIKSLERIKVTVPAGVDTGTRLRLKAQGGKGFDGGPDGDLYVIIHVADDSRFRRDGDDVVVDITVPLKTVMLGGAVDIPLPDGSARMTVPASTQGGRVFRLRKKGFPRPGAATGVRGDLLATVRVQIPTVPVDLVDDVTALLAKLAVKD